MKLKSLVVMSILVATVFAFIVPGNAYHFGTAWDESHYNPGDTNWHGKPVDHLYLADEKDRSISTRNVYIRWNSYQTGISTWDTDYINQKKAEIKHFQDGNFDVVLRINPFPVPDWYLNESGSRFKNQYDEAWEPDTYIPQLMQQVATAHGLSLPGDEEQVKALMKAEYNVDYMEKDNSQVSIWDSNYESRVRTYIEQVITTLNSDPEINVNNFWAIYISSGQFGEVAFPGRNPVKRTRRYNEATMPPPDPANQDGLGVDYYRHWNSYWGFDMDAQAACPVAGWEPTEMAGQGQRTVNGGFEDTTYSNTIANWWSSRDCHNQGAWNPSVINDVAQAATGSHFLRYQSLSGSQYYLRQEMPVRVSTNYDLSGYIRAQGGETGTIVLRQTDDQGSTVGTPITLTSTLSTWNQVSQNFTTQADAAYVQVDLYLTGGSGTVDFDAISVLDTVNPTADHSQAEQFINWYYQGLANAVKWQIAELREHYNGRLILMGGGDATRPGDIEAEINNDLSGKTKNAYWVSRGFAMDRYLQLLVDDSTVNLTNVYFANTGMEVVWNDWENANRTAGAAWNQSLLQSDWSAPKYYAEIAREIMGAGTSLYGENGGANNLDQMNDVFQNMQENNYEGLGWYTLGQLFEPSQGANILNYADQITQYNNLMPKAPTGGSILPLQTGWEWYESQGYDNIYNSLYNVESYDPAEFGLPLCTRTWQGNSQGVDTRTGDGFLVVAGKASSGASNPNSYYWLYNDFLLPYHDITIGAETKLCYWIYPYDDAGDPDDGNRSVAVDLIFSDGTALRDHSVPSGAISPVLLDQNSHYVHPAQRHDHLTPNAWNYVEVDLSAMSGQTIEQVWMAFDDPNYSSHGDKYRVYIDDLKFTNTPETFDEDFIGAFDTTPDTWKTGGSHITFTGDGVTTAKGTLVSGTYGDIQSPVVANFDQGTYDAIEFLITDMTPGAFLEFGLQQQRESNREYLYNSKFNYFDVPGLYRVRFSDFAPGKDTSAFTMKFWLKEIAGNTVDFDYVKLVQHPPIPVATPSPSGWAEEFTGAANEMPTGWRDRKAWGEYNARIEQNGTNQAVITLGSIDTYGDVITPIIENLDIAAYSILEFKIAAMDLDHLDVNIQQETGSFQSFSGVSVSAPGVYTIDLGTVVPSGTDMSRFSIKFWPNDTQKSGTAVLDYIEIKAAPARVNGTWENIGDSFNFNITLNASGPSIEVYQNDPYTTWIEHSGLVEDIFVKQYIGQGQWELCGTKLNMYPNDHTREASVPELVSAGGYLYATWAEGGYLNESIYVKRWNGAVWTQLPGLIGEWEHYESENPQLSVDMSNTPYVTWAERRSYPANNWKVYVTRWSGSTWQQMGGRLNIVSGDDAGNPDIALFNTTPYVTWVEGNKIYVKHWTGSGWAADGGVLNRNSADPATGPEIVLWNNMIHVAWLESRAVQIKRLNGSTWEWVGQPLQVDPNNTIDRLSMADTTSTLSVVCQSNGLMYLFAWDGIEWKRTDPDLDRISGQVVHGVDVCNGMGLPYVGYTEENDGRKVFVSRFIEGGITVPTATPTAVPTPLPSEYWREDFNGSDGVQPVLWQDYSNYSGCDGDIQYNGAGEVYVGSYMESWGKVLSPPMHCDVGVYSYLNVDVSWVKEGATYKIGIQEIGGAWNYWDLTTSLNSTGIYYLDYQQTTGWSGEHDFYIQLTIEGMYAAIKVDWITLTQGLPTMTPTQIITMTATPTPTPTSTVTPTVSPSLTITISPTTSPSSTVSPTPSAIPTATAIPSFVDYSTYHGGSSEEKVQDMHVDANGYIYIAGITTSNDLPVTTGVVDETYGGGNDGFVVKYAPDGQTVVFCTYFGGSDNDNVRGITTDSAGNIYITGTTWSSDFTTTAGAYDTALGGARDAFIAKLSSDGQTLLYSTYLGGSAYDYGFCIDVESVGDVVYVGGFTHGNFPVTSGAAQETFGGMGDGFVTKFNMAAGTIVYSTYLGGQYWEPVDAIIVKNGEAYLTGHTQSPNFPVTQDALDSTNSVPGANQGADGYFTKLSTDGSTFLYSTFIGPESSPLTTTFTEMAIDTAGNIYLVGDTSEQDFAVTAGCIQPGFGGGSRDGIAVKLNANYSSITFSTFLGGDGKDGCTDITIDTSGNLWITGMTDSSVFPESETGLGGYDVFVSNLNATGDLLWSGRLGGSQDEGLDNFHLKAAYQVLNNMLCVTGRTTSQNFPVTSNAEQSTYGGGVSDSFLSMLGQPATTYTPTPTPSTTATPTQEYVWEDDFNGGTPGEQPSAWEDETEHSDYNADIYYSQTASWARVSRTAEETWGKVLTSMINCDVDTFPMVQIKVSNISADTTWKVGIQETEGAWQYWNLNSSSSDTGNFVYNYKEITSWTGIHNFSVVLSVEGAVGTFVESDFVRVLRLQATPTPTVTPTVTPTFTPGTTGIWNEIFSYSDDNPASVAGDQPPGWYDETDDAGYNAEIEYAVTDGLAELTTVSGEQWGKVLSYSQSVDLASYPMLEVVISDIPQGTAKIMVFSQESGWEEYDLSGSLTVAGTYAYDIPSATGWSGVKNFGIQLISEGGTAVFDSIISQSGMTPTPTVTPVATNAYIDIFDGTPGEQPADWRDESQDYGFDAHIAYATGGTSADVSRTQESTWGKVLSSIITCDTSVYTHVEIEVDTVLSSTAWKLGIQEEDGAWQYWDLNVSHTQTGTFAYDYAAVTGWTGMHSFRIQITVEGDSSAGIEVDQIRVCQEETVTGSAYMGVAVSYSPTCTVTPTPTMTATLTPTMTPTQVVLSSTLTATRTPTATSTPWLKSKEVMAYPNPARGQVNFAYTVSGQGKVVIDIYKLTGERVATVTEHFNAGTGQTLRTAWDAVDVAPGIYFCRIVITDGSGKEMFRQMKKVALIK
ncbi:SBBP repeat-containing protein [bacterium]|nr:SBBP repeat-containing protein [bacterium]